MTRFGRSMAAASAACILLSSCGTVTRGREEDVTIQSMPANASIKTSTGQYCPQSPCTIRVERRKSFTATAELEGYQSGTIDIKTKISDRGAAGFAGNVLVGGVIGMGVDAATGAALDHYPNPALIVLQPVDPKNPKTPPQVAPPTPKPTAKAGKPIA